MEIFMVSSITNVPNERLLAMSVIDRRHTVQYEKHTICPDENIFNEYHTLFTEAINYILDELVKGKGISVRHLNVIGDINELLYSEYNSKRSSGTFYGLSKEIKKGTVLHDSCKSIYEMFKNNKIHCYFNNWRIANNGKMYSDDRNIKNRLEKLAGDKCYDREKALKEFLKENEYGVCIENVLNALIPKDRSCLRR